MFISKLSFAFVRILLFDVLEKEVTPVSPGSVAYVYQPPAEEDSDVESLVDELWGLCVDGDSDSEEDDEEEVENEEEDDVHEDDHVIGDLPEDINARSNYRNCIFKKMYWSNYFVSFSILH